MPESFLEAGQLAFRGPQRRLIGAAPTGESAAILRLRFALSQLCDSFSEAKVKSAIRSTKALNFATSARDWGRVAQTWDRAEIQRIAVIVKKPVCLIQTAAETIAGGPTTIL